MIGGEDAVVKRLDPIFATLAPGAGTIARTPGRETVGGTAERGYLHCGTNGAGHFVKMVHNGIEYGIMAAYAEGLAPGLRLERLVERGALEARAGLREARRLYDLQRISGCHEGLGDQGIGIEGDRDEDDAEQQRRDARAATH